MTVALLLFASPGTADVVEQVIELATGVDCCEDGCDDEGSGDCENSCAHCRCCAHVNAIPVAAFVVPDGLRSQVLARSWLTNEAYSAGYRAPPFRPPTA